MTEQMSHARAQSDSGAEFTETDIGPGARLEAWADLRSTSRGKGTPHRRERSSERGELREPLRHLGTGRAELLRAWREKVAHTTHRKGGDPPGPPVPAPGVNWIPIGPTAVRRGQAGGNPPVSGRTSDIAIAPGGLRAYAATANGGVWRTDNGGVTWSSTMDSWDLDPHTIDVDSLACGAIAIDPAQPDRVYVGTGEGESAQYFRWVLGIVYSYGGVGPLRSDNGGDSWVVEPVAAGSASLVQQAFYALAVDPQNREHVLGATTAGLYRREPDGSGGFHWRNVQAGDFSSVTVARGAGTTRWFAAAANGSMMSSPDGSTWTALGTGHPTATSRVSLAVQPTNTSAVYAFSSAGLYRWDATGNTWRVVTGGPSGDRYRCAIEVDPSDVNLVYLGGLGVSRAAIAPSGSGTTLTYSATVTAVGGEVHPDLHRLRIRGGTTNELWAASDGGVYRSTNANTAATFASLNVGLATITCTYLSQHPTQPALVFVGAQDNGQLRYTGEEAWLHSADGDGGACIVNWADPYKVISSYIYGSLRRTTDGGSGPGSWSDATPSGQSGALFYPPLVGTPVSGTASDAEIIAMGASRTFFSPDFGGSWSTPDTSDIGTVSALAFSDAHHLYAGTTSGSLYSYTRTGMTWAAGTLVGAVGGTAASGLAPIVTDIAIDPSDTTGRSCYVCLGGVGDWRRVWHYDGTTWQNRSGPSATDPAGLIAVHFNALAADPAHPGHVYAGADIGIWKTTDGGAHWTPYEEGLPDAGVTDLLLDSHRRLLRAATYGRGVFEREIDATSVPGVRLYVRDTALDLGRWPSADGLADPEALGSFVRHWNSANIKVDVPSSTGTYQTPSTNIDFFQFVDRIVDGSGNVATRDPSTGTVVNRVYVEVHNRGIDTANNVRVMLLLTDASTSLPPLPAGYWNNVTSGTTITTAQWRTVGFRTLNGIRAGLPMVAEFDLPSTMLPPPSSLPGRSHYCLLAIVHSVDDPFTSTNTDVDSVTVNDAHVAQKNLHIVPYAGPVPPGPLPPMMGTLVLGGEKRATDLLVATGTLSGTITLLLPEWAHLDEENIVRGERVEAERYRELAARSAKIARELLGKSLCDPRWAKAVIESAEQRAGQAVRFRAEGKATLGGLRNLTFEGHRSIAWVVEPEPADGRQAEVGDTWTFDIVEVDRKRRAVAGGSSYQLCVTPRPSDNDDLALEGGLR